MGIHPGTGSPRGAEGVTALPQAADAPEELRQTVPFGESDVWDER